MNERDSWLDQVKDTLRLGLESHRTGNVLGIVFFWTFAVLMTASFLYIGLFVYDALTA